MQTPKTRNVSLEGHQKTSIATPRTARQLKTPVSDSDSFSSSNPSSWTPKNRSPKVAERGSPRSPMTEKKRPGRVSELESQLAHLQEELKKVKDQLSLSEALKRRAQQEAEESNEQLAAMLAKLEDSQQQLLELSSSEEARVQQLCKISKDRDRAWQSELEALQKQHSVDSVTLASSMNEIQKLKKQLESVAESEAEIQDLRVKISEALLQVEKMKNQLNDCKESEAQALEVASETQMLLESTKATAESFRVDGLKVVEAYESLASELKQSKAQASSLELLVNTLKADLARNSANPLRDMKTEKEELEAEIESLKFELGQLKSSLETSEIRYQEEYIESTMQIQNAYEEVERAKCESSIREAKLEEELKNAMAAIEELKSELICKETKLLTMVDKNKELNIKLEHKNGEELEKLEENLTELKAALMEKETQLQNTTKENEMLKMEIKERDTVAVLVAANAAETEALMKLGCMTEEAEKGSRRVARVSGQLTAVQTANGELEAELKRLRVQSDQWRKAAEAAAAMLSPGSHGKPVDRSVSLDSSYHMMDAKIDSPFSDDMDDEWPKKKNMNMLKKIGVLWKK
ncbi:hypothetical protein Nepgr_028248 [Nepenthes gracilis]|uniref:Interactor of constitutive active ROPs 3 n=1 Tax=Nepenthes gracilis TaxID=150966 RepID=A0AAD3T9Y9_NEPGR|nr:hypothetical protein Nepgr_028248 [Nepenthes gracilis]